LHTHWQKDQACALMTGCDRATYCNRQKKEKSPATLPAMDDSLE